MKENIMKQLNFLKKENDNLRQLNKKISQAYENLKVENEKLHSDVIYFKNFINESAKISLRFEQGLIEDNNRLTKNLEQLKREEVAKVIKNVREFKEFILDIFLIIAVLVVDVILLLMVFLFQVLKLILEKII